MQSIFADCWCAPNRQLWQLFESVRQHFTSPSVGPAGTQAASGVNAATEKAVVDRVRDVLPDTDSGAAQPQQGMAEGNPVAQQASSSRDRKKRRKGVIDASEISLTEHGEEEAAIEPSMCQVAGSHMQGGSYGAHRTHQVSVDGCGPKQRPDALAQRVCPVFGHVAVQELSLCHLLDVHIDHSCRTAADCGVDSVTCRARECSVHGYCQEEPK